MLSHSSYPFIVSTILRSVVQLSPTIVGLKNVLTCSSGCAVSCKFFLLGKKFHKEELSCVILFYASSKFELVLRFPDILFYKIIKKFEFCPFNGYKLWCLWVIIIVLIVRLLIWTKGTLIIYCTTKMGRYILG